MKEYIASAYNMPIDIVEFLFDTFFIIEQRALIGNYKNISFEVKTKEQGHNRPHIHASFNHEKEISISIDNKVEIIAGNLPKKQEKIALKWTIKHLNEIRKSWNNYHIELQLSMVGSSL